MGDEALVTNQRVDEMIMCTLGDNRPWAIGGADSDGGTPEMTSPRSMAKVVSSMHRTQATPRFQSKARAGGHAGRCPGCSGSIILNGGAMWPRNRPCPQRIIRLRSWWVQPERS